MKVWSSKRTLEVDGMQGVVEQCPGAGFQDIIYA